MLAALFTALVLSQAPPAPRQPAPVPVIPTERLEVGPLWVDIPLGWRRTWRFGTARFDAPDGSAYVLMDSSQTLTPNLNPAECRDKIVANLGGKGHWRSIDIGGLPGAEAVVIENSQNGSQSVVTARYVGCDGNSTWSMLFEGDYLRTRGYFELLVRQVISSVRYGERPGPTK